MKRTLAILGAFILVAVMFSPLLQTGSAHSIDYLAASISPAGSFNGNSGNFALNSPVAPNSTINFTLTIGIQTNGQSADYPRTVTFGANNGSTASATVTPSSCTFVNASSTCTLAVAVTAPATAGNYHVKIVDTGGTGGNVGLTGGGGVLVHFVVAGTTSCSPVSTSLVVDEVCVLLHQAAPATLKATLTPAIAGKSISFTVDGNAAGAGFTDVSGVATVPYDVSTLSVGDHDIIATFDGDCDYEASSNSNTLGVSYGSVRFQQPINADGSSIFKSVRTIPVKILVTDGNGVPVTDAQAFVFFGKYSGVVLGTESESVPLANTNNDSGNQMRLGDASIGQYVFNWNTTGLENGTYRVRIDLGEGVCGGDHVVDLSFKRK